MNKQDDQQIITAELVARCIADWAFSDAHVKADREVLIDALLADYSIVGRYPTEKECELLVTGDDEGEVPKKLQKAFPQTDELLASYWE